MQEPGNVAPFKTAHDVRAIILVAGVAIDRQGSASETFLLPNLTRTAADKSVVSYRVNAAGPIQLEYYAKGELRRIDIYDADWDPWVTRLSKLPWYMQLFQGVPELLASLCRAVQVMFKRPGYATATLIATIAGLAWAYASLAVAVTTVHAQIVANDSRIPGWISHSVAQHFPQLITFGLSLVAFFDPQNLFFVLVGLILTNILHVQYKDVIDVIDLYWRYFSERGKQGALSDRLLRRIDLAVEGSLNVYAYPEILIVGHSFGALLAADWVGSHAKDGQKIRLITLGSFLQYLSGDWKKECLEIISRCAHSPNLVRWDDFFSRYDFISSTDPLLEGNDKYIPHSDALSLLPPDERTGVKAHVAYYKDPDVLRMLLDGA
jgi:hypothetical protein